MSEQRSPLDLDRIRQEELLDAHIHSIADRLKQTPSPNVVLKDSVVYKIVQHQSISLQVPFLPKSLLPAVLYAFHDYPSATHFGRDRTFVKLRTRCD